MFEMILVMFNDHLNVDDIIMVINGPISYNSLQSCGKFLKNWKIILRICLNKTAFLCESFLISLITKLIIRPFSIS